MQAQIENNIDKEDIENALLLIKNKPENFKNRFLSFLFKYITAKNITAKNMPNALPVWVILSISLIFVVKNKIDHIEFSLALFIVLLLSSFSFLFVCVLLNCFFSNPNTVSKQYKENMILNLFNINRNAPDISTLLLSLRDLENMLVKNYHFYEKLEGCLDEYVKFYGETPKLLEAYLEKINSIYELSEIHNHREKKLMEKNKQLKAEDETVSETKKIIDELDKLDK